MLSVETSGGKLSVILEDTNKVYRVEGTDSARNSPIQSIWASEPSLLLDALYQAQNLGLTYKEFETAHTQSVTVYIFEPFDTYYRLIDGRFISTENGVPVDNRGTLIGTGQVFFSDESHLIATQGYFYILSAREGGDVTQLTQLDISDPEYTPRDRLLREPENLVSGRLLDFVPLPEIQKKVNKLIDENGPIGDYFSL
jgi:hypothetical protein